MTPENKLGYNFYYDGDRLVAIGAWKKEKEDGDATWRYSFDPTRGPVDREERIGVDPRNFLWSLPEFTGHRHYGSMFFARGGGDVPRMRYYPMTLTGDLLIFDEKDT